MEVTPDAIQPAVVHQPLNEGPENDTTPQRRPSMFKCILILTVVMMMVSIGSIAYGINLSLRKNASVASAIVICCGAAGFFQSLCPFWSYSEAKKASTGEQETSSNHSRTCGIVCFIGTVCVTSFGALFSILLIVVQDLLQWDENIGYVALAICSVLTSLSIATMCPLCCCADLFGFNKSELDRRQGYIAVQPDIGAAEEMRVMEDQSAVNVHTVTENTPLPTAPSIYEIEGSDNERERLGFPYNRGNAEHRDLSERSRDRDGDRRQDRDDWRPSETHSSDRHRNDRHGNAGQENVDQGQFEAPPPSYDEVMRHLYQTK